MFITIKSDFCKTTIGGIDRFPPGIADTIEDDRPG